MGRSRPSPVLMIGRGLLLLVAAGFLIKLIVGVSVGNILEDRTPKMALRFAPTDPEALTNQAALHLQEANPGSIRQARRLALEAARRSPVKASAYSLLGYVADADRQQAQSQRLLNLSLELNRRELLTHLWFIEKYSAQGDIGQALRHYDIALKTSAAAHAILIPILINAAKDTAIQAPLTSLLVGDPSWADPFLRDFITKSDSPEAVVMLAQRLRRAGRPLNTDRQLQLMERLVTNGRFNDAARAAGLSDRASVIDDEFQRADAVGPFAWNLTNSYTYGAAREERPSQPGRHRLTFFVDRSGGGEVARQLLVLPPGRYRLSTRAAYAPRSTDASPLWRLSCADVDQGQIVALDLPSAPEPTEVSAAFSVPPACSGQWLTLQLRTPTDLSEITGQVDRVAIARIN